MDSFKNNTGSAALVFSDGKAYDTALIVSNPPPSWLSEGVFSEICISEEGLYCIYFLLFAPPGFRAAFSINDRKIKGSETETCDGTICASAVCSIHTEALPCSLSVVCEPRMCSGIFLVVKCSV